MAVVCTPASLSAAAECYSCALTHRQEEAAQTYLLAQIAVAVGALTAAQVTPAALAAASECIDCALTPKLMQAVQVYLLCTISGT